MDTWFSYVFQLSELIFNMKLEAYEDACAALVLSAVGVHAAVTDADNSEAEVSPSTTEAATTESALTPPSPQPSPQPVSHAERNNNSNAPTAFTDAAAPPAKTVSVDDGASSNPNGSEHGHTPSQSTTSPMSSKEQRSESGTDYTTVPTANVTGAAPAAPLPLPSPSRRATPPVSSPAETVSALLDAMQLWKPLRTVPSRNQLLDEIEAEADVVYQDLEEVFTLRPGDVPAVRRTTASSSSQPASLPASEFYRCTDGPSHQPPDRLFPSSAVGGGEGDAVIAADAAPVSPALEHQLLYGELTPAGVRQLQAISMASVSVSREYLSRSRSQNFGFGATPPGHSSGGGTANGSFSYGGVGGHAGSPRNAGGGTSLLTAGNLPRGAVVMCVDVGCGNGRLLFEWARLATAACRRKPESSRRRSHTGDIISPPASPQSTHNNSMTSGTYAAAARRGNLLAAAMAPLGVPASNIMWRGWLGVGMEIVPSRIRVARRALVPHYLNLKPALLVPADETSRNGQREEPVLLLDPVAPETIAVSTSSGSLSNSTSFTSTAVLRKATNSLMTSPTSAGVAKLLPARIPQPTARVLLYEGDAFAPGVLSNATLCRFPHYTLPGDTLTLLRGGNTVLGRTKTHDLVNGLGGERMGSLGSVGYYAGSVNAPMPMPGGAPTCPYPTVGVVAAGAALNNAYLNNTIAGAHGRKGGPGSFMEMGMCSVTSNASSNCSTRGGSSAKHNYYRLCRVENGPSLTGREDPHLVVFCCGLGFDESQVWKLCQRLEDILLARTTPARSPTRPASVDGFSSSHNMSEDEANNGEFTDAAALPVNGDGSSDDNGEVLEEMTRGFGRQVSTPTTMDPLLSGTGCMLHDQSTYRHWESVTCVLLLRPMDVLAPNFPLFRYATRVYTTQEHPVAAEDTAVLLAAGNRTDGTAVHYVMRDLPISDLPQDANVASTIQESDIWMTTLETTWMNAAPAWVVRFRF